MENREHSAIGLYTIGIAALFLAGFLLLVVFGAQSYRNTVGAQNGNMQNRAVLAGISTAVRGFDARDAVSVSEDQVFGQVLNLSDGDSGYALRLYWPTAPCWRNIPARMPLRLRRRPKN